MKLHRKSEWAIDALRSFLYDKYHRVETRGKVNLRDLKIPGPNAAEGTNYRATPATTVRHLIRNLPITIDDTAFVDLGSGKGRCLLVASEYSFRAVRGVEFSEHLHRIAAVNIARYRGRRRCRNVVSVCEDASQFSFPDGRLVVHFFNPFGTVVLREVLRKLEAHQAEVLLAFVSGSYAKDCVASNKAFSLCRKTGYYDIYRTRNYTKATR